MADTTIEEALSGAPDAPVVEKCLTKPVTML